MIRLSLMDFIALGVITCPCNNSAQGLSKGSNALWDKLERIQFCCNIYRYLGVLWRVLTARIATTLFLVD